ncbi:DUF4221 family protein [Parabacteroides chinchillae]
MIVLVNYHQAQSFNHLITMKKCYYILLFIYILSSCKNETTLNYNTALVPTSEFINLNLDDRTTTAVKTLFLHTTKEGKEYIVFQNEDQNEIQIYELPSCELFRKIKFQEEGPEGVGKFIGFYITDLNNYILTRPDRTLIYFGDSCGHIRKQINYQYTDNKEYLIPGVSATATFGPIAIASNSLLLTQLLNPYFGNKILEKAPVCIAIDTIRKITKALPFHFPPIKSETDILKNKMVGNEYSYSRCFNGKQFVYSFSFDEKLYVTSLWHDTIITKEVKSKYIDHLQTLEDYSQTALKKMCEIAMYRNIVYDPFRQIYYRIVYPEVEVEESNTNDYRTQLEYGHKKFAIIILGETVFPEYIYNPMIMFVRKDGLYISRSHYKNPDYDDSLLCFERLKLETE